MEHINQKYHCQSIVGYDCDQVIYGRDQRTGSNSRVNVDLVEKHRDDGSNQTGDHHCHNQGDTHTAGD